MAANTYTLINYFDVWGNSRDGWEVNDQCIEFDDLIIDDDANDQDILHYLKDIGFLVTTDRRRLEVVDDGTTIEVYQKKGMKPICGLIPNF